MRIAFVVYWDPGAGDGVAKKIRAQVGRWRDAGHDAEVFAVRPAGPVERIRRTRRAVADVFAFAPDVVYLRYDIYPPPIGRVLRAAPTAIELNADDRAESRLRGRAVLAVNAWNRRRLFGAAAGFVSVTHELAQMVAGLAKPVEVIANGADPDRVPWTGAPVNERPRAVFVGSPAMVWHGVDVLLDIARALPGVDFDLVGPAPAEVPANVRAHGVLPEREYLPLLARADVAFGSLAMGRAGLREGCPLKVREYLLAGVPVVIGYDDTDFLGEPPWFVLRSVDPSEVRAFVERVRGRRVDRADVAHLTVGAKEAQRLAFFERLRR